MKLYYECGMCQKKMNENNVIELWIVGIEYVMIMVVNEYLVYKVSVGYVALALVCCLPCGYMALRAVLKVSLGYVALALVCCLPCGYVALWEVLKVSIRYVALAFVCCLPCGYVALRAVLKVSLG